LENLVLLPEQAEDCHQVIFFVPSGLTPAFLGAAVGEEQEHLQDVGEAVVKFLALTGCRDVAMFCRCTHVSRHYHRSVF